MWRLFVGWLGLVVAGGLASVDVDAQHHPVVVLVLTGARPEVGARSVGGAPPYGVSGLGDMDLAGADGLRAAAQDDVRVRGVTHLSSGPLRALFPQPRGSRERPPG